MGVKVEGTAEGGQASGQETSEHRVGRDRLGGKTGEHSQGDKATASVSTGNWTSTAPEMSFYHRKSSVLTDTAATRFLFLPSHPQTSRNATSCSGCHCLPEKMHKARKHHKLEVTKLMKVKHVHVSVLLQFSPLERYTRV